jgi:hypothetical protein
VAGPVIPAWSEGSALISTPETDTSRAIGYRLLGLVLASTPIGPVYKARACLQSYNHSKIPAVDTIAR